MAKVIIFLFCVFPFCLSAQSDWVVVNEISIEGNRKTRRKPILRELDFTVGDTILITELASRLERNRQQILNSGLFTSVSANIKSWDQRQQRIAIQFDVNENLYIYPIPIFELADRNFNVWWVEQERSLSRINFGGRLYHLNATGRADLLKLVAQFGYTQKFEIEYSLPAFNRSQTLGLQTNWYFSRNKEVYFDTKDNKQDFQRLDDRYLFRRFRALTGLTYRPKLFFYHNFQLGFYHNRVDDYVISELNPDFFLDGRRQQRYFSFRYHLTIDRRDIKPYPWKGYYLRTGIGKEGLGVFDDRNALFLTQTLAWFQPVGKKVSIEWIAKGRRALLRKRQAFYNNRALGFDLEFLRGYEYYVIDGLDFAFLKTSVRIQLLNTKIDLGKSMPFHRMRIMPLRLYLSINNDLGGAYDPYYAADDPLNNRLLVGTGIGLDIVSYETKVWQVQYTINHLGEKGLFLHYKFIF